MLRPITPVAISPPPNSARRLVVALLTLLTLAPLGGGARAADKPVDGLIVQVPTSVTTESVNRLRSDILGRLNRFEQGAARQGGKFFLICDFNPDAAVAESNKFGACYELAKYLRELQTDRKGVTTVAYVHGDVRRHSVLPVLACAEIMYSDQGQLGPVAVAGTELTKTEQSAYEEISKGRRSAVLVRKMYDPTVEVVKVGDQYLDANANPRERGQPVEGLPVGELAAYKFALARQLGLAQPLAAATVDKVREAYGLPHEALHANALDRTLCWRIPLEGMVNGELVEQTKRRIERALRAKANVLVLDIKCVGGSHDQAHQLGLYLTGLNDRQGEQKVLTIAFVSSKARNLATFLAFSCNKIVLQQEAEDGKDVNPDEEYGLGGFAQYIKGAANSTDGEDRVQEATTELEETLKNQLSELAGKQSYPPALVAGMFNRAVRIHLVERAKGATAGRSFLTEQELQADQRGDKAWRSVQLVKPWQGQARYEGRYLTLTARQAKEIGLAHDVVKNLDELYEHEGINPADVKVAEADWLDGLADFLRAPLTSALLVMIGITCLILELKMPGVGLPGVIAAICFVLFFWAHSQLHGQITWLAILLFVLGLVLVGLEVFVIPGFGVCGISGVLLILTSLGLVAYGQWPQSSEEWVSFGNKIGPFGVSMLGSLCLVVVVVRYLPHIPVLNRLMLRPAEDGDESVHGGTDYPLNAELQALLGAIGVAATPLRPAGKTQFGDTYVDVVAEGGYIMPGTRVQVIEVEGNRVVVKEV